MPPNTFSWTSRGQRPKNLPDKSHHGRADPSLSQAAVGTGIGTARPRTGTNEIRSRSRRATPAPTLEGSFLMPHQSFSHSFPTEPLESLQASLARPSGTCADHQHRKSSASRSAERCMCRSSAQKVISISINMFLIVIILPTHGRGSVEVRRVIHYRVPHHQLLNHSRGSFARISNRKVVEHVRTCSYSQTASTCASPPLG